MSGEYIRKASTLTDTGRREHNEDSHFYFSKDDKKGIIAICAVADGAGGLEKGELASGTTIALLSDWAHESWEEFLEITSDELKNLICDKILDVHDHLKCLRDERGINTFGTTLTLLFIVRNMYIIAQVGDSRAYLYRDQKIKQITKDQTKAQMKKDQGIILTGKELIDSERTIWQCLGSGSVMPHFYEGILPEEYMFLLCSDGVSNCLSEADLQIEIEKKSEISTKVILRNIFAKAQKRGETDNMTGILYGRLKK